MPRTQSTTDGPVASPRRDLLLSSLFTALGLVGIIVERGGIGFMIAGSVGSVGAGLVAVGLAAADRRFSYIEKVQACLPVVLMLFIVGLTIKAQPYSLAGYPLLALGLVGLVPALRQGSQSPAPETTTRRSNSVRVASEAHATS